MFEKFSKNLIPIAIAIAGLLIAVSIIYINQEKGGKEISENLSPEQAAEKAVDYINQNLLRGEVSASLVNTVEENGLYKFNIQVGESGYDFYVTKDGELLFLEGINMIEASTTVQEEAESQTGPKRDNPDVKLFVMSYCPYGLQAQKMFLPVYDLLKDKAEMAVYFVNYIMHGKQEIDENLNQYCIQKEEKEKYSIYLNCFVINGDSEKCLSEAMIDRAKLANCISEADKEYNITSQYNDKSTWLNGKYPKFDIHSDLNEKYKVGGSPTVIINDKVVNVNPRSLEQFKKTICLAFNSPPEECSQTLSNNVPSPGIGGGTSSSSGGQCE